MGAINYGTQGVKIMNSEDLAEIPTGCSNEPVERGFGEELCSLINRHSMEGGSNTPDFMLAEYIDVCLSNFNAIVQKREAWHGREPSPAHTRYGVEMPVSKDQPNAENP